MIRQVFNVEATGQYRKLFKLYALPGTNDDADIDMETQKVDIRDVGGRTKTKSEG